MIFIITNSKKILASNAIESYFRAEYFNDFQTVESQINSMISDSQHLPLAIISQEKINEMTIYNLLDNKKMAFNLMNIPIIVFKDKLDGNEMNHINNALIDDFVPKDVNHEDLIERLRFLITHKEIVNDNHVKSFKRKYSKPLSLTLRRIFDVFFCSTLLILLSPIFLLVAIIIKIESQGPIIYTSYRAGTGYNIFTFYKFRTMISDADKKLEEFKKLNQYNNGNKHKAAFFKLENDPRITRFGAFLRNSSIDELPQLINVLLGDMALIGNRPLPLYEAQQLTRDGVAKRFDAPSGITGLWQVEKRGQKDISEQERIELDMKYAETYSVFKDIEIFFKTFSALNQKETV